MRRSIRCVRPGDGIGKDAIETHRREQRRPAPGVAEGRLVAGRLQKGDRRAASALVYVSRPAGAGWPRRRPGRIACKVSVRFLVFIGSRVKQFQECCLANAPPDPVSGRV